MSDAAGPVSGFDARAFLRTVPEAPGVYRMIGAGDTVLYVGKAKNLKRRVASYFRTHHPSPRIGMMVSQIVRVDLTVTRSEAEALIVENNLIKALAPRYNILFRDDKSYPYIVITGDPQPRLGYHRGSFTRGARYFGPFPNSWAARETIQLLQKTFRLRTCENSVFNNRSRPCLLHQIRRCSAPCVERISNADYAADVKDATRFLDGQGNAVLDGLGARMEAAAEALQFEQAAVVRDQIRALQAVLHRQFAESRRDEDVDVIVAEADDGLVCINIAMVRSGRHLGDRPQFPTRAIEVDTVEALLAFVEQHYQVHPMPARLLVAEAVESIGEVLHEISVQPCAVVLARRADEKAWIEMARSNARLAIRARSQDRGRAHERLDALAAVLALDSVPGRIECFDISHTMGEATVASCVVCVDGQMSRGQYRRYNITGITAGDDYAAMRQVLERRYGRLAEGEGVRPDLILIDGGKGQLSAAFETLAGVGLSDLLLVGVAKGEGRKPGLETLVRTDGQPALHLDPSSSALHLVQEIRDEAHRFAISGHRARRGKARIASALDDVPGVGPTRRRKLLTTFGGIEGVRAATVEDLLRVDGIHRRLAEQIHAALR